MKDIRKSGLDVIGDAPWGAHFCLFYQTREDFLDILVPYFKAGLENNEFCMWVVSESLGEEEAMEAMRRVIPDFDQYIREGQIEIVPHVDWYLKEGYFDQQRILDGWIEKLNQAFLNGFDGMRLSGNAFWHEKRDWKTFSEYEETVNSVIGKYRMIALCTYSLDKCGTREVMDVVRNHHMVLIRSGGEWNVIESLGNKEIRQALQKSEEQFRSAFDYAPIGMALVGLDGHFLKVNQALCNIVGYTGEELLKLTFQDITHPDDLEADLALTAKLFAGEIPSFRLQKRYIHKNGNIVWISLSGSVVTDADKRIIYAIAQIRDISERKRTEEALRETSHTLQMLFDASPLAIIALDSETNVKMWNPAAARLFGWSAAEVISRPISIIPPEQMQEFRALFEEEMKGRVFSDLDLRRMKKDGSFVDVRLWTAPFRDAEGNVTGVIGMFTDITERKKAEEKIACYQEQLRSLASELLSVEEKERHQIATDLHDHIGQTLAVLKMKLGALQESISSSELTEHVDELKTLMEKAIEYMRSLTFELSPPVLYELGLEAAVERLTEDVQRQYGIQTIFTDDGRHKPIDEKIRYLMYKAVQELLMNVVKHARAKKGTVSISREGDMMRIMVEDDGIGFNVPQDHGDLMRTSSFGLFSIRERLRHVRGQLKLESEAGSGSRVTMIVPLEQ